MFKASESFLEKMLRVALGVALAWTCGCAPSAWAVEQRSDVGGLAKGSMLAEDITSVGDVSKPDYGNSATEAVEGVQGEINGKILSAQADEGDSNAVEITFHVTYPDGTKAELKASGVDQSFSATAPEATFEGWYMARWFENEECTERGPASGETFFVTSEKKDYYVGAGDAHQGWRRVLSTVTFALNDDAATVVTYRGYPGERVRLSDRVGGSNAEEGYLSDFPEAPERENYEFVGWFSDEDSETSLTTADIPSTYPYPAEGERSAGVAFSARWRYAEPETPTSSEPIDLYEMLTYQDGSSRRAKSENVLLESQGEYYLSQSVEGFSGQLIVQKSGRYNIDLRGNSISFGKENAGSVSNGQYFRMGKTTSGVFGDSSRVQVSISGGAGSNRGGLTFFDGGGVHVARDASLSMDGVELKGVYDVGDKMANPVGNSLVSVADEGVGTSRVQKVDLRDCDIVLDMTKVTSGGTAPSITAHSNTVIAVDVNPTYLDALTMDGCSVSALAGTPAKGDAATQPNLDAIALSVRPGGDNAKVAISNSELKAVAQQGSAIALYNHGKIGDADSDRGAEVSLSGDSVSLDAKGSGTGTTFSIGLLNASGSFAVSGRSLFAKPAAIGTTVKFSGAGKNSFALASDSVSKDASKVPFTLAAGFGAGDGGLPVYVGSLYESPGNDQRVYPTKPVMTSSSANTPGSYIASFGEGMTEGQRVAASQLLSSATGSKRVSVASVDDGIRFESSAAEAEASIQRGEELMTYGTFEEAVADLREGETLTVERDLARAVEIGETAGGAQEMDEEGDVEPSRTVDLCGHAVGRIEFTSGSDVLLHSSAERDGASITGTAAGSSAYPRAGIVHGGKGTLVVDGLSIKVENAAVDAYGAVMAGKDGELVLRGDCTIDVEGSADARGVFVEQGSLKMEEGGGSSPCVTVRHVSERGSAIGVETSVASACDIGGSTVVVSGSGGELVAASGSVEGSGATLSVREIAHADRACDVEATGAVKAVFDDCSFELDLANGAGASDAGDAVNVSVSAEGSGVPEVVLSGRSSFSHFGGDGAVHVRHAGGPLSIAQSFSLAELASALVVESSGLEGAVFAVPASDDADLAGKAGMFKVPSRSSCEFAGHTAKAKGKGLSWSQDAVAKVGDAVYESLAEALAAADENGTVTVLRDFSTASIATSKDVAIDLAGHTVTLNGTGLAGVVVGSGKLTLKDSRGGGEDSSRGRLLVRLTSADEGSALGEASGNKGILVRGSGALDIDGASVEAVYEGLGDAEAICAVYTAVSGAEEAPVTIKNGSSVTARSSSGTSLSGAHVAYAVYDGSGESGKAVFVDETSEVASTSTLAPVKRGGIVYSAGAITGFGSDTSPLNDAGVRLFDPSGDASLYQEICNKFRVVARYDGSGQSGLGANSEAGVYGAGVYWAAPMQLDDGTYAWAFSEPVAVEDMGKAEAIAPAAIYLQSTYESPYTAVGIGSGRGAKGSVEVHGSVNAASSNGDAYALMPLGSGASWSVLDGAKVSAAAAQEGGYLKRSGTPPDLKKQIGIDQSVTMASGHNFYPSSSRVREVAETAFRAAAIAGAAAGADSPAVTIDGSVSLEATGAEAVELACDCFAVGSSLTMSGKARVTGGDWESAEGAVFACAAGDGVVTTAQRDFFADALGSYAPVLASDGKSLSWGEAYTLVFKDYYGNVVDTATGVLDGHSVPLPKAARSETATSTFTLAGWSTDPNAKAGDAGVVSGESFTFGPGGSQHEVTYYAIYAAVPKTATVTFVGGKDSEGSPVEAQVLTVKLGEKLGDAAGDAPHPASYGTERFVGWRATVSSAGAITDESKGLADRVIDPSALGNYATMVDTTLTAWYVYVPEGWQLASFKVDDYVYAYAVEVGDIPAVRDAMATIISVSSTLDKGPEKNESGASWKFAGWYVGASDKRYEEASIGPDEVLPTVAEGPDVFYTAVFEDEGVGAITSTVTLHFFNNWGSEANPDWKYNLLSVSGKDSFQVPFGSDLAQWADDNIKLVDYVEKDSGWHARTFLGWSTRSTDREPLGALLPRVGSGYTSYYAIYSDEPMTVELGMGARDEEPVKFSVEPESTIEDIEKRYAEEGCGEPAAPKGKVFAGWTDDEGVASALASTARVCDFGSFREPAKGDGEVTGSARLFPVFKDAPKLHVTLHGRSSSWADRFGIEVRRGLTIPLDGYAMPRKDGYAFVGWNTEEDGSGSAFDIECEPVEEDGLELWAQYVEIAESDAAGGGADVDASGAYLSKAVAIGADSASVTLSAVALYDRSIVCDTANWEPVQAYRLGFEFVRDGDAIAVSSGFGTIRLTLPVPEEYVGRDIAAYIVNAAGGLDFVKCGAVEGAGNGGVTAQSAGDSAVLEISNFGASNQGNILVTAALTPLARTKLSAIKQMQDYLDSLREEDYSASDYELVVKAFEEGSAKVRAASSAEEVRSEAQAAVDAMAAYPSMAGLATAKATALERLAAAYSTYNKNDYTDEGWAELTGLYAKAKESVENAMTASGASAASSQGIIAMSAVSVKPGDAVSNGADDNSSIGSDPSSGTSGKGSDESGDSGGSDGSGGKGSGGSDGSGGKGSGGSDGSGGKGSGGTGSSDSKSASKTASSGLSATSGLGATVGASSVAANAASGLSSGLASVTSGLAGGSSGASGRSSGGVSGGLAEEALGDSAAHARTGRDAGSPIDDAVDGDGAGVPGGRVALRIALVMALVAALTSLIWWSLRRRGFKFGSGDDDDFWENEAVPFDEA